MVVVKVVVAPLHIVLMPVTVGVGLALNVTETCAAAVQPKASVTVKVCEPVVDTVKVLVVVPFDHI
jgi:hypothetical protein